MEQTSSQIQSTATELYFAKKNINGNSTDFNSKVYLAVQVIEGLTNKVQVEEDISSFYPTLDTIVLGRQQSLRSMYELSKQFDNNGRQLDSTLVQEIKKNIQTTVAKYLSFQKLAYLNPRLFEFLLSPDNGKSVSQSIAAKSMLEFLHHGRLLNQLEAKDGQEAIEYYVDNYWAFISPETNDELRPESRVEENGSRVDPPTNNETLFKTSPSIAKKTIETGGKVESITDICRFTILVDDIFDQDDTTKKKRQKLADFVSYKVNEINTFGQFEVCRLKVGDKDMAPIRIGFYDSHYSDIKIFVRNKITGQITEVQLQTIQTLKAKKEEEEVLKCQPRRKLIRSHFASKILKVIKDSGRDLILGVGLTKNVEKFLKKPESKDGILYDLTAFINSISEINDSKHNNEITELTVSQEFNSKKTEKRRRKFKTLLNKSRQHYKTNSMIKKKDDALELFNLIEDKFPKQNMVAIQPSILKVKATI